jgi:hypothetical protein
MSEGTFGYQGGTIRGDLIDNLRAEILRLRAELADARNEALEETTRYADLPMTLPSEHGHTVLDLDQCEAIAAGIRALKTPPATETEPAVITPSQP